MNRDSRSAVADIPPRPAEEPLRSPRVVVGLKRQPTWADPFTVSTVSTAAAAAALFLLAPEFGISFAVIGALAGLTSAGIALSRPKPHAK
jgi:hypothetical protein